MHRSDLATGFLRAALALLAGAWVLGVGSAGAVEIGQWNFADGTANDSVGAYDLTPVGGGPTISGGVATFDGNEAAPSYLETAGYGASPNWTVGVRLQATAPFDQGSFQGILSNNNSSTANFSWQLESFSGIYQIRTLNGVYSIGAATGGWDLIVIRKIGGNDGDVWFNGVQVVSSFGSNPGGLQNFRFGTNRNSNNFYAFALDSVRIFDSVEIPSSIPEPGPALFLGLGLIGLRLFGEAGRPHPGDAMRRTGQGAG